MLYNRICLRPIKVSPLVLLLLLPLNLSSQEMGLRESKEFSNLGDYVRLARFSPYRNYFAFTLGNNTLRVYDRNWDKVLEHQGNPKAVGGVFAFSPDEKYLVYGRYKGLNDMAIIRLEDMKVVSVLQHHNDYVNYIEFSHDGRFMASVSADKQLILWDVSKDRFRQIRSFGGFDASLYQASFSMDDRFLVTGDSRGNVLVLEREGGNYREFQRFQYRRHSVEAAVFHPRKEEFITGSLYGYRRYRLHGKEFRISDSTELNANIDQPVFFSPDGNYVASGNYTMAVIHRVGEDSIYTEEIIYRHMDNVFGASFSEDGEFFCTYSSDHSLIIWEIDNISPSDKAVVVSWLNYDLTLAQRRSLDPGTVAKILRLVDRELIPPKDEFETTPQYESRKKKLAGQALGILQREMEKKYGVKPGGQELRIPIQELVGYNADLEIYKLRFMETEAGLSIPIAVARKFKEHWEDAHVSAVRQESEDGLSFLYSDFRVYNPVDRLYYELTPVENPFFRERERTAATREVVSLPADNTKTDTLGPGGTTYALMFASNVYDYYSDLVNPVLDAQTIAMELSESYGVKAEVVLNPTLSETASVLREYASRSYGTNDNLMVFFAGHGIYDEVFREGYVISRDSKMDDLGKTSYLSHSNLRTMINNIGCPHIFLVMDVCFGGTFDPHLTSVHRGGSSVYADISTREFIDRKMRYKTRLYLTSGGKEYVPDGRPGFHSPFARRFIESLRHYGGDDGVLTTSEILQFVEKVNPQPRFGEFGDNEPGSDFILVVR